MSVHHRIIVRPEAFGCGFDVVVDPPAPDEILDREFATHREARGYASGLRLTRRWPIVDQTDEAAA